MGVTGLWTVVQPCARPIKIETLNRKRLAVDASIWIYQFLKAVRDKEGNALRNSHVVGFFRRICKILFFGIKPVFVFDGGAPALKRQTIIGRKARREGRREDAVRTAGKLLALQMQRRAEEEERKRKEELERPRVEEEEALPENLVYVDELHMTPQERQQNRKFKKKDQYHLPDLDVSLAEMGGPNDPRVMSLEELQEYARQFDTGEDINVYDFSKIDFDSDFFTSLPASDRYNILNAARLRSRLRMGYSKEQLDTMFPDRMAFSRFQIERVRERNELTQRLMNLNGMVDDAIVNGGGRVAGEKGREYVLVRNEGAEGGWALGVVTSKDEGERDKPINVDRSSPPVQEDENEGWEEDEFEDIPIEGLNRLPKRSDVQVSGSKSSSELTRQKRTLYNSRQQGYLRGRRRMHSAPNEDPDSLFLAESPKEDDEDEWENVDLNAADPTDELFEGQGIGDGEEDEDLQRAIQMSLQPNQPDEEEEPDDYVEVFQQAKVEEARPFNKGSAQAIARMANNRSSKAVAQFASSDTEQDDVDLQSALAESRRTKRMPRSPPKTFERRISPIEQPGKRPATAEQRQAGGFDGPLPFEKLDLGSSLLGKKKMQKMTEDNAGGFEKDVGEAKRKDPTPPPWFSNNDIREGVAAQEAAEANRREKDRQLDEQFQFQPRPRLRQRDTLEVIDLDAPEQEPKHKDVINIDSEDEDGEDNEDDVEMEDVVIEDPQLRMGDIADMVRAEPPEPSRYLDRDEIKAHSTPTEDITPSFSAQQPEKTVVEPNDTARSLSEDEPYEWEESDHEGGRYVKFSKSTQEPAGGKLVPQLEDAKPPSPEFEDVLIVQNFPTSDGEPLDEHNEGDEEGEDMPVPMSGLADQYAPMEDAIDPQHEEIYSDPEDEELFRQLAVEAEEHARFASSLNNKSQQQNAIDYERELKQLRNQQKRDRRDADEVTQTMIAECQQLLSLFGLPYITAPMEAEAQCAELVRLGLVDGIVTDDSDIFLFGGTRVYKNMFNQAKFVECYLSTDLEAEFSLTRERLISIAQLLGSDYTEGLPGVGPVTALEILGEFDDLTSFKEWWTAVQNGSRKKEVDRSNPFRRKFRKNTTKLFLPPSFPDRRVTEAYLKPEVDSDPSEFVWGVPDLDALRSFLIATIGWTQERADEILVPVIRDMNTRQAEGTQSNITAFFGGAVGAGAFAPRRKAEGKSKRLESALGRMAARAGKSVAEGEEPGEPVNVQDEETRTTQAKGNPDANGTSRKAKRSMPATPASGSSAEDEEYAEPRKKAKKKTRGGGRASRKRSKVQVTTP